MMLMMLLMWGQRGSRANFPGRRITVGVQAVNIAHGSKEYPSRYSATGYDALQFGSTTCKHWIRINDVLRVKVPLSATHQLSSPPD